MWYKRFFAIMWIGLVIFVSVKGSCLEYGHSCWGAHGKRSGGKALGEGELKELKELVENSENAALPGKPFESLDELDNFAPAAPPVSSRLTNRVEEVLGTPKLKGVLRQRQHDQQRQLQYYGRNMDDDEDAQQRQRLYTERWPLFNRPSSASSATSRADRKALLQQLQRQSVDDGAYYDFQ